MAMDIEFGDFFNFVAEGKFNGGTGNVQFVQTVKEGFGDDGFFGRGNVTFGGGFNLGDDHNIGGKLAGGFVAGVYQGDKGHSLNGSFMSEVDGSAKGAKTALASTAQFVGDMDYSSRGWSGDFEFRQMSGGMAEGPNIGISYSHMNGFNFDGNLL